MSYQLKVSPLRLHHENLRVTFTIQEENWQLKQSEKKIKLLKVSFQLYKQFGKKINSWLLRMLHHAVHLFLFQNEIFTTMYMSKF